MIDLEMATQAVEAKLAADKAALVAEEAAQMEHRAAMAATGNAIIMAQERNRAAKIEAHGSARTAAREAMDALAALRAARESSEEKVGHMRGDLEQATKWLNLCVEPHPDSYPTDEEISAWKTERAELDDAVRSISARIFAETSNYEFALRQEEAARAIFDEAARREWERRSDL